MEGLEQMYFLRKEIWIMRRYSFEELIELNKQKIMKDKQTIAKIEKKVDENIINKNKEMINS